MKLNINSLKNESALWREKGFIVPSHDTDSMRRNTLSAPEWIHFGPGNIFRGYISCLADDIINSGDMTTGIVAADSFDSDTVDSIYEPFDDLVILVGLRADGNRYLRLSDGIGQAVKAIGSGMDILRRYAALPSLKMISFTITEKGYAVTDIHDRLTEAAASDAEKGPDAELSTAMGKVTALLHERFKAGGAPITLVSMDNCSHNGDKLKKSVLITAEGWKKNGLVTDDFIAYISDDTRVSFPLSMIDKITPRPDPGVSRMLTELGIEDMEPKVTRRGTYIAPFVNAEMPQYLIIEDRFPNGRPPLEKAGVYLTDRETVNKAEKMKVMTCLNPLHTALAIFGCLLGFTKISDEMNDNDLKEMVYRLGYKEGLPVSADPGIIRPEDFLKEVLTERLPNPNLPDTPQRIATDTSQKLSVRFGGTISAYESKGDASSLEIIPLVIAGWLRYLTAISDSGSPMKLSDDPMLEKMTAMIKPEWFGNAASFTESDRNSVIDILHNRELFGTDLVNAGLSEKIMDNFVKMLAGTGAVRRTLREVLDPQSC